MLLERLTGQLIVSCQPVVGGPLDRPDFVVGFARAAEASGAAGLRIEGLANLRAVRAATALPIIGIDATLRTRPVTVAVMTAAIHGAGKLAMADVATSADAKAAIAAGVDVV